MNVGDYETKYLSTYEAFAETVRFILNKALLAAPKMPRPQSIQHRAKGIESLRRRLVESGKMDTQMLEDERRDLAGVRLIFYTNKDVDRFVESPLINDNFEIEENSTKIHHPRSENQGARYRAIHYTVRLREDRRCLPEYSRFAGLRCEIQVQTILEHAWAETSHDIIYKNKFGGGYGEKVMKGITSRFGRIMDKYLIPAGYEIQTAQRDYERLLQGSELFDKDIGSLLNNAQNNNERYEILSKLKDYAIPNYDDPSAAFAGLEGPLLRAVKAARVTEPVPIETKYGNLDGFKTDTVTSLIVEIVESLRYANPNRALQLLIDIYRDEPNENTRQQILNVVKKLSEYNIDVYNRVGPMVQLSLVDYLAGMNHGEINNIRPIALTVWTEAIQSDITGTKWEADSVILSSGALPVSDQLKKVRDKAIKALFTAYDKSTDDLQKRAVLSALGAAMRTPSQGQYSNELLAKTLEDSTRIVNFMMDRAAVTGYELLQHGEHRFFYEYRRARRLTEDPDNRFGCQAEAKALVAAILKFRDSINTNDQFVRYKILVGFESIYVGHWANEDFDHNGADEYRRAEADRYIQEITEENENHWFDLIERCAKTKSNDLATFPVFGNFINKLAERKPEVAERLLSKASDDLRTFLPGFLNGLAQSGRDDIYARILDNELESARALESVSWHLRKSDVKKPDIAACLLKRAIAKGDRGAVIGCLLLALEHYGTEKVLNADMSVCDALSFLNDLKDASWVSQGWFLFKNSRRFYEELTPGRTAQFLQNLGYLCKVDHQAERILVPLAERQPAAVWDYFGERLAREAAESEHGHGGEHFETVPFRFHGLEKELSKDPQLAISKGLAWFSQDRELFEFRGGRLLSNTFPNCPPEFVTPLADLVKTGGDTEADFALKILQNFDGATSTHGVLKEIVSRYPADLRKLNGVRASIDSTGCVSGEFGFVEAYRVRKESLISWLTDDRPEVKAFAEKHITELDAMIASEHRRAETRRELRSRSYEDDENESDNSDAHAG